MVNRWPGCRSSCLTPVQQHEDKGAAGTVSRILADKRNKSRRPRLCRLSVPATLAVPAPTRTGGDIPTPAIRTRVTNPTLLTPGASACDAGRSHSPCALLSATGGLIFWWRPLCPDAINDEGSDATQSFASADDHLQHRGNNHNDSPRLNNNRLLQALQWGTFCAFVRGEDDGGGGGGGAPRSRCPAGVGRRSSPGPRERRPPRNARAALSAARSPNLKGKHVLSVERQQPVPSSLRDISPETDQEEPE
nr:elongin BC and Polycomb repressive complex 2-associated protein-like [Penaeus vannamei]